MTSSSESERDPDSRLNTDSRLAQRATAAVELLLGDSVRTAHPVARGFVHSNVYVQLASGTEAIVKFPHWPRPDKQRHVVTMLERLRLLDIPVPVVLAEDLEGSTTPEPVVILSYLPGETLADAYPTLTHGECETIGSALGQLLASIHAVEATDRCQGSLALIELDRRVHRARESGLIPEEQLSLAKAIVEGVAASRMDEPARVIHGDVYPDNIIVAGPPGQRHLAGLIDFDHVDYDDPARDFVKLRWWVFEPLPSLVDPILSGYLHAAGDPDAASPVSHRFMTAALLETMAGIVYFTERNDPHDHQMAADFRRRFERLIGIAGG